MTTARAKAPTLAWLLTALTCLLAGMAIVESRHQVVALPVLAPDGADEVGGWPASPTVSPAPMPGAGEAVTLAPTILVEGVPVRLSTDYALLRVERLTVPPGGELSADATPGLAVLLVETGTLSVPADGVSWAELGHELAPPDTVLRRGQRLVVAPGERYNVRNDGPAPAVALMVTIAPVKPSQDRGSDPGR